MQQPVLNGINQPCFLIVFLFKGQNSKKNLWFRVWKGFFRVWDSTKIRCGNGENDKYIDGIKDLTACFLGSRIRQKLGMGCRIYVCVSIGNAGNHHNPLVLAAKANKPGEH